PGTESLPPTLAQPWPQCKLPANYNPYTLTYSQITVNGVYCIINPPPPPPRSSGPRGLTASPPRHPRRRRLPRPRARAHRRPVCPCPGSPTSANPLAAEPVGPTGVSSGDSWLVARRLFGAAALLAVPEGHLGGQPTGSVAQLDTALHQVVAHLLAGLGGEQQGQPEADRDAQQESGDEALHAGIVVLGDPGPA